MELSSPTAAIVPSSACDGSAYAAAPFVTCTWREPSGVEIQMSFPLAYVMLLAWAAGTAAPSAAAAAAATTANRTARLFCMGRGRGMLTPVVGGGASIHAARERTVIRARTSR